MAGGLLCFLASRHWRNFQFGSRNKTYTIQSVLASVSESMKRAEILLLSPFVSLGCRCLHPNPRFVKWSARALWSWIFQRWRKFKGGSRNRTYTITWLPARIE